MLISDKQVIMTKQKRIQALLDKIKEIDDEIKDKYKEPTLYNANREQFASGFKAGLRYAIEIEKMKTRK